jgi:ribosome-associated protein
LRRIDLKLVGEVMSEMEESQSISIPESELEFRFVHGSGPGGQNVNKVATVAELRFDARSSPSLPDDVRARLLELAGKRATKDGLIVITAQRYRTQERNRKDALDRLEALIREAEIPPKPRKRTRPSKASKETRLKEKRERSRIKKERSRRYSEDTE